MAGRIAIGLPGPISPPGIGRGVQSFASWLSGHDRLWPRSGHEAKYPSAAFGSERPSPGRAPLRRHVLCDVPDLQLIAVGHWHDHKELVR